MSQRFSTLGLQRAKDIATGTAMPVIGFVMRARIAPTPARAWVGMGGL